jgi:hypothetical protein
MNPFDCPISGEKILAVSGRGVVRLSNYAEIWFELSDGSKMRMAISKNARKDIGELKVNEIFAKIKTDMLNSVKSKVLDVKTSKKQLARINKLTYTKVFDREKTYVEKKNVDN